jgi:hypothetical protein
VRDDDLGLVTLNDPFARPLHQLFLELAVLACTVLVFGHALRAYRAGDRRPMFQWLVLTSYGVQMELIAFNFLHNYEHAQFTVQLYHGQLPLYVTGLYGTFMYTGIKVAERLGAPPIVECLVAGLAMCLIDVPFDIAGVSLGWWRWLDTDPNLAFRWLGVPVTSYYWYLIFGAIAAQLCRVLWRRLEKRPFAIAAAVALPAGFAVVFFGVLGFLPFHAIKALGVDDGTIVAAHIAVCAALALAVRGESPRLHPWMLVSALLLPVVMVLLLGVEAMQGRVEDAGVRFGCSAVALVGLALLSLRLPLRRAVPAPDATLSTVPR